MRGTLVIKGLREIESRSYIFWQAIFINCKYITFKQGIKKEKKEKKI